MRLPLTAGWTAVLASFAADPDAGWSLELRTRDN